MQRKINNQTELLLYGMSSRTDVQYYLCPILLLFIIYFTYNENKSARFY